MDQCGIANQMPPFIIDLLKIIQVEHQHAKLAVGILSRIRRQRRFQLLQNC
jgi:hypothetical protein